MGIKQLTQTIKKRHTLNQLHENVHKLSGKKVAVDASLVIYQWSFEYWRQTTI